MYDVIDDDPDDMRARIFTISVNGNDGRKLCRLFVRHASNLTDNFLTYRVFEGPLKQQRLLSSGRAACIYEYREPYRSRNSFYNLRSSACVCARVRSIKRNVFKINRHSVALSFFERGNTE